MSKKVLIFGIEGFVGRYLYEEFIENGYLVVGAGKLDGETIKGKYVYYQVDILNTIEVNEIVLSEKPDIIVNLAAISSVGISWMIPQETIMVNVVGSLNILEAARKLTVYPKILFIGSSEEYIISNYPMSEDRELNATNPYGVSKVTQEHFSKMYRDRYGMKIYCVRPFNHTGVGQRDSFVLSSWCKQVAEIEKSRQSGVIRVGDITVRRDFSHVKDIVKAYRLVLENGNCELVYNIGYGKSYRLEEMLNYIINLSSQNIEVVVDKERFRPFDQPIICCDHSLISNELGWEPEFSVFDALKEMYEYYLNME